MKPCLADVILPALNGKCFKLLQTFPGDRSIGAVLPDSFTSPIGTSFQWKIPATRATSGLEPGGGSDGGFASVVPVFTVTVAKIVL